MPELRQNPKTTSGGSAQARLERSRNNLQTSTSNISKENGGEEILNPNRHVIETDKKQITVKVQFDRSIEDTNDEHNEQQQQQPIKQPEQPPVQLVATTPSWTPNDNSQWQPMPINQWETPPGAAPQPQS